MLPKDADDGKAESQNDNCEIDDDDAAARQRDVWDDDDDIEGTCAVAAAITASAPAVSTQRVGRVVRRPKRYD